MDPSLVPLFAFAINLSPVGDNTVASFLTLMFLSLISILRLNSNETVNRTL